MWPFADDKVCDRLAGASAAAPAVVSVLTTIVSPPSVVSPFTGMRAGLLLIELLERMAASHRDSEDVSDRYDLIGTTVLGDVVTLRDRDGDEITIVARRARISPALPRTGGTPIIEMPPELVPLLARASGQGMLCYRELTLSTGDELRLRAVVEPTLSVVADGYRSGTRRTYVARDDLAPVVLEEVFSAPAW